MELKYTEEDDAMCRRVASRVARYARVNDSGDFDDALQTVRVEFLRLQKEGARHDGNLEAYLFLRTRHALNCVSKYPKTKYHGIKKTSLYVEDGMIESEVCDDETGRDAKIDVEFYLDRCPPREREIAVLRFIEELDAREVAKRLSISVPGVYHFTKHALAYMRGDHDALVTHEQEVHAASYERRKAGVKPASRARTYSFTGDFSILTERERAVVELLNEGLFLEDVAKKLGKARVTVWDQMKSAQMKLEGREDWLRKRRADAARIYRQRTLKG